MTASFPVPLAVRPLPRGAVASILLPECGDLPAIAASLCGDGRALSRRAGKALAGVAAQEMHERGVGGDELRRGSVGHLTLHVRDVGTLNPTTSARHLSTLQGLAT